MNIVFLGTSSKFSFKPLTVLSKEHKIVGVIESVSGNKPNRIISALRNLLHRNSLKKFARKNKTPYVELTKKSIDSIYSFIEIVKPDIACVASLSYLLPEKVLSIPKHGFVNFHPSVLPKYRGPVPILWQYSEMDLNFGVTIHFLDKGEDSGNIIKQESFEIPIGYDGNKLMSKIINRGSLKLLEAIDDIEQNSVKSFQQDKSTNLTRARRLKNNEKLIDWDNWSIERVFHYLAGTYRFQEELSIPCYLKLFSFKVRNYAKQDISRLDNNLHFSLKGFFIQHKQGRIYLRILLSPIQFAKNIIRIVRKNHG